MTHAEQATVTEASCKGKTQYPINIKTIKTKTKVKYREFPPFKLEGHDKLGLRLDTLSMENTKVKFFWNDGKDKTTIVLKAKNQDEKGKDALGLLTGGPLRVPYLFKEMYFHWGDDEDKDKGGHNIDGEGSDLELFMVHRNIHERDDVNALKHEDGFAVLVFRFEVVRKIGKRCLRNEGLDNLRTITENHLTKPDSKFDNKTLKGNWSIDVNVMSFLPVLMDEYFYYTACDRAINWIVFKNPLAVTKDQFKGLQKIKDESGEKVIDNFPKIKRVKGRPIYYHGQDLKPVDQIGSNVQFTHINQRYNYTDFLLTLPNCLNYRPAPMIDCNQDESDRELWENMDCDTDNAEMEIPQEQTSFTRGPQ